MGRCWIYIIFCFFSYLGNAQVVYENEVFSFIVPKEYTIFDKVAIKEMNTIQQKEDWNRVIFGFTDNVKYSFTFQIIEINIDINSIQHYKEMYSSAEMIEYSKKRGVNYLSSKINEETNYTHVIAYNEIYDEYINTFSFLNKTGIVVIKVFSKEVISESDIDFIPLNFTIATKYKGFPSYNIFYNLDWDEIFLKAMVNTLTSKDLKLKKSKK